LRCFLARAGLLRLQVGDPRAQWTILVCWLLAVRNSRTEKKQNRKTSFVAHARLRQLLSSVWHCCYFVGTAIMSRVIVRPSMPVPVTIAFDAGGGRLESYQRGRSSFNFRLVSSSAT